MEEDLLQGAILQKAFPQGDFLRKVLMGVFFPGLNMIGEPAAVRRGSRSLSRCIFPDFSGGNRK